MLLRITKTTQPLGGRADDGGAEMDANQPALNIRAPVWTHEPAARPQSITQALEALAQRLGTSVTKRSIRSGRVRRVLVPGCLGCGKAVRPSGRRAAPNRRPLAARRFFWFRGARQTCLHGRGNCRRHRHRAISRLADGNARSVRRRRSRRIGRHHLSRNVAAALLASDHRPHHRRAEGRSFLAAHARTRRKWRGGPVLVCP